MNLKKSIIAGFAGTILLLGIYSYKFRHNARMLITLNLTHVGIKTLAYSKNSSFPEKLWLHRVNSVQRAKIIEKKYRGLEIDVHFDSEKNCFDIFHSPGASTNLCLEELLTSLKDPKNHYYWLDFKNLDSINQKKSFESLQKIATKYVIKKNIVIESDNPSLLTLFTQHGFYTSYYLPPFNPFDLNDEELKNRAEGIADNLSICKVNAISGYYYQYPFIQKYFPTTDALLWHIDHKEEDNPYDIFSYLVRRQLINNPQVQIILIPEMSEGFL